MIKHNKKPQDQQTIPLPDEQNHELFAIAENLSGGLRINVTCADGKNRLARIPGRMKQRIRVRTGDLLIIRPWEIQNEKADVIYRYTHTQSKILKRRKLLPEYVDVF